MKKPLSHDLLILKKEYAWQIGGALSQQELEEWKLLYHSAINGLSFNTFMGNISETRMAGTCRSKSCSQLLETLPLPNIKWICPTAPTRPVAIFGGFSCTTWFDVGDLSEEGPDDVEGMDASAAHIANLLSTEPANTKLGIGGFSTGAAMALYSASCCTHGQFGNGNPYPINISAVVALSGWLPRSRSLKSMVESSQDGIRRAASLPILMCQGRGFRHTSMMELSKAGKDLVAMTMIVMKLLCQKQ